jgi:hypothetical protein
MTGKGSSLADRLYSHFQVQKMERFGVFRRPISAESKVRAEPVWTVGRYNGPSDFEDPFSLIKNTVNGLLFRFP